MRKFKKKGKFQFSTKPFKKKLKSFLKFVLATAFLTALWLSITLFAVLLWFSWDIPNINNLEEFFREPSIVIKDRHGNIVGVYGDLFIKPVPLSALPPYVKNAFLAVEDRRFYKHFGIDVLGILRAFVANRRSGHVVQGGSSITQQLAKNILISSGRFRFDDKSYRRKVQELVLALQIERKFKKDDILSLYLNRSKFGGRATGIEAASQQYFKKPAVKLTVFEAAMIAGALKAPSRYSLHSSPQRAIDRAALILRLMVEAGFLKSVEPYLEEGKKEFEHYEMPDKDMRYFTDWIVDLLPIHVENEKQEDLEVIATIDCSMQKVAEYVCKKYIEEEGPKYKAKEVAFVAMSPQGEVLAMVGGNDYAFSQYNRVTQAKRQAGSAIKTFIYLAALEHTDITIDSMISDLPVHEGNWSPSNFHWAGKERGEVSVETGFINSVNAVCIRLAKMAGVKNVLDTIQKCGIYTDMPRNLTVALGTGDVTLIDLTGAMASFSNGGHLTNPYGIISIKARSGKLLYKRKHIQDIRIMSKKSYQQMRTLLNHTVTHGTGRRANINGTVFGKTGSNADRDTWFAGFREGEEGPGFSNVVAGTWVGNDHNEPMKKGAVGGLLPAMITKAFLMAEKPTPKKPSKK